MLHSKSILTRNGTYYFHCFAPALGRYIWKHHGMLSRIPIFEKVSKLLFVPMKKSFAVIINFIVFQCRNYCRLSEQIYPARRYSTVLYLQYTV